MAEHMALNHPRISVSNTQQDVKERPSGFPPGSTYASPQAGLSLCFPASHRLMREASNGAQGEANKKKAKREVAKLKQQVKLLMTQLQQRQADGVGKPSGQAREQASM